jgi:hypothetical protein
VEVFGDVVFVLAFSIGLVKVVSNRSHYLLCSAYWEVFGLFKIVSVKLL